MNLREKLAYARAHVESILRHDDEPLEAREAAAAELIRHVEAEFASAKGRETPERAAERGRTLKEHAARRVLDEARARRQKAPAAGGENGDPR